MADAGTPRVTIIVVIAPDADPARLGAVLESARGQVEGAQLLVVGELERVRDALVPFEGELTTLDLAGSAPAEVRNEAVARAEAPFVLLLEPGERLSADALPRHVSALESEPALVGSYGRVAIHGDDAVRVRPERGKGGPIFGRLLKERHLIPASAALVWRREALGERPFDPGYRSPTALRLALALELARDGREFVFHPAVVAERPREHATGEDLEELVKVFATVLYGPEHLDEKREQRARKRLGRTLVSMGKHFYRAGDYRRAGKLFDEAVKAAPGYFQGRRYQFLNFVKNTITRDA